MTDDRPLVAGVMGWPIGHSRSPRLFDHWFRVHGMAGRYVPLAVRPEDFAEVYRALPRAGFRGVNVTVPHKIDALARADRATDAARAIGAANTIVFEADGSISADNTDAYGVARNLAEGAPGWSAADGPAVVLGAGGAARAVLFALREAGAPEIRLANRTREKAEVLAAGFPGVTVVDWDERAGALSGTATLINATSLGMTGAAPLEIDLGAAPQGMLVNDLVYTPLATGLITAARARGLRTVDGLGMLLHQARPAFRAWFGADPAVDGALRDAVLGP